MNTSLTIFTLEERRVDRKLSVPVGGGAHRTDQRSGIEITIEGNHEDFIRFGRGEASPLPQYSVDTLDEVVADLATVRASLPWELGLDDSIVSAIEQRCASFSPATRCALETALLDLAGQYLRRPLWSLLTDTTAVPVPLSQQLMAQDDQLATEAARLVGLGHRTLKRKLVAGHALPQLRALAGLANVTFRLDANRTLSLSELRSVRPAIEALPLDLFEEPVDVDLASVLRSEDPVLMGLPIGIDESLAARSNEQALRLLDGFDAALRARRVAAVVVKPTRDGLLGAWRLARAAADRSTHAIVTHTWEGATARLACAHLALAVHREGGIPHAPELPPDVMGDEHVPAFGVLRDAIDAAWLQPFTRAGLGSASDNG
jgi:L-alanine-DL-glutamate epimerase-like enolase superfamily enzyme